METEILAAAPDIPPLNDDFSRRVIISLNPSTVPSAPRGGLFSFWDATVMGWVVL